MICPSGISGEKTAIARLLAAMNCDGLLLPVWEIPLKRVNQPALIPIAYGSAIACKLAPLWHCAPVTIATAIATDLLPFSRTDVPEQSALDRIWHCITLDVAATGKITFQVSEAGLAAWLQLLLCGPPLLDALNFTRVDERSSAAPTMAEIFEVLYTHARCCSLVRLGLREGVLPSTLSQPTAAPLPWLTSEQKLRCQHPSEQRLIVQLVATVDELSRLSETDPAVHAVNDLKLARSLSQRFQAFDAACRLFGEVRTTDPQLAQARLGLVVVTQLVLRSLLQRLHQAAPLTF